MSKLIFTAIILCFLLSNCKNYKRQPYADDDIESIKSYLNEFYNDYENYFKNEIISTQNYFLYDKIEFYIQNNNTLESEYTNTNNDFLPIIKNFRLKSGKFLDCEVRKISFENTIYDIPETDLFIIQYDVIYENFVCFETFILKPFSDDTYKIYRYFIIH
jgi:hypothetical protein